MSSSLNTANYSKRTYKIVLLGNSGVGKTCLIERFTSNKYDPKDTPTVGIDFLGKNVSHNNKTYRLQLWDTAGQERYRSLIPSYLKDSLCAIFVYDVTDQQSLENVQQWIKLYRQTKGDKNLIIICGNKYDLQEIYDPKTLTYLTNKYNCKQFKVSALSGENVDDMFKNIIDILAYDQVAEKRKKLQQSGILLPPESSHNFADKLSTQLQFNEKKQQIKTQNISIDGQSVEANKKCWC